jgi:hypothetical protein
MLTGRVVFASTSFVSYTNGFCYQPPWFADDPQDTKNWTSLVELAIDAQLICGTLDTSRLNLHLNFKCRVRPLYSSFMYAIALELGLELDSAESNPIYDCLSFCDILSTETHCTSAFVTAYLPRGILFVL